MTSSYPSFEEPNEPTRSSLYSKRPSLTNQNKVVEQPKDNYRKEITNDEINKLGNLHLNTNQYGSNNQYNQSLPSQHEVVKNNSVSSKSTHQNPKEIIQPSPRVNEQKINQTIVTPTPQHKQIDTKSKNDDNYEVQIKCVQSGSTVLTENPISIMISSPEKHSGGFFTSDYITYLVETSGLNFKVRRRYSDFEWLRSILVSFFPAFMISPIPGKNFGDRLNDEFITQRMRFLEVLIKKTNLYIYK